MNLKVIKTLFNLGKLTVRDAEWYLAHGYDVVCGDGQVQYVAPAAE